MTDIATGNARLLRLADFLEKLPPERFDYKSWVGEDWRGDPDLSCGTTACALGWATAMPEFQALGLRLRICKFTPPTLGGDPAATKSMGVVVLGDGEEFPSCPWSQSSLAAQEVFGVSDAEAELLFLPDCSYHGTCGDRDPPDFDSPDDAASPREVADHIRRFVAWRV